VVGSGACGPGQSGWRELSCSGVIVFLSFFVGLCVLRGSLVACLEVWFGWSGVWGLLVVHGLVWFLVSARVPA